MILLILVLIVIIALLLQYIKQQQKYINIQEKNNREYLQKWRLRYSISQNMQRIYSISKDIGVVEKYMHEQGINVIAVYGIGEVGRNFIEQMQQTDVEICYGIDRRVINIDMEVRKPEEVTNDMDIILVTAEIYYLEIYQELRKRVNVPIVLLSQFLDEIRLTTYLV